MYIRFFTYKHVTDMLYVHVRIESMFSINFTFQSEEVSGRLCTLPKEQPQRTHHSVDRRLMIIHILHVHVGVLRCFALLFV